MAIHQRATYSKPWLSHDEQVVSLQSRGLTVADPVAATKFLAHLNYYRFSGYCLAFEVNRHEFAAGATFEQIVATYRFDVDLRDLLTEALEAIEVDLRSAVAYMFGKKYGRFGHVNPGNFWRQFQHDDWIERLRKEACRSSELFVQHYEATYDGFPDLPIWIVTEVMSFGCLSKMVDGMLNDDKKIIASRYGLQPDILTSWMHHLVYVRNLCAHHCRVWDKSWSITPVLPPGNLWQPPSVTTNKRLLATLLIISKLMNKMPAIRSLAVTWRERVAALLATPPEVPDAPMRMGLSPGWTNHAVWR